MIRIAGMQTSYASKKKFNPRVIRIPRGIAINTLPKTAIRKLFRFSFQGLANVLHSSQDPNIPWWGPETIYPYCIRPLQIGQSFSLIQLNLSANVNPNLTLILSHNSKQIGIEIFFYPSPARNPIGSINGSGNQPGFIRYIIRRINPGSTCIVKSSSVVV